MTDGKMIISEMSIISKTQSICPICRKPVEAYYVQEAAAVNDSAECCCCQSTDEVGDAGVGDVVTGDVVTGDVVTDDAGARVFFVQDCPEHGQFKTLASERADDFKRWIQNPVINIPPKQAITQGDPEDASCPLHCGTCQNHLQTTCCVLIDVTQRCNQHCPYCFALSGSDVDPNEPTLEEISAKYDWLLEQGEEGREFNIQLSGGEPTVRDDLPEIIRMAREKGFSYVQINSNGRRLAEEEGYARLLKEAGASVIFMQFDGTDDDIYLQLRGEALFDKKVQAVRNCEKAGLAVTLVPTIVRDVNDHNIGAMMDFLVENVNVVKGIHFQPASFFGRYPEGDELEGRITMFGLLRELEAQRPEFKYADSLPISTGHTLCCFYSTYIKEPDGSVRCTLSARQREEGVSCCDAVSAGNADAGDCCCESNADDCCCGDAVPADTGDCYCGDQTSTSALSDCCCGGDASNCAGSGVVTVGCCDMTQANQLEVIRKDRDYVLDKWDIAIPDDSCCCGNEDCSDGQGRPSLAEPDFSKYKTAEEITDMDEFLTYYKRNTFTVTGMAFQDITNLDAERLKRCRVVQLTDDNRLVPFCAYNTIYR